MRAATVSFITLTLTLGLVAPSRAQDRPAAPAVNVAGDWDLQMDSPRGTWTARVTFEQNGSSLGGHLTTPRGEIPIANGSVSGTTITFTIRMERGERSFERTYTGTVDGDTARGTVANPGGGTAEWAAQRVR